MCILHAACFMSAHAFIWTEWSSGRWGDACSSWHEVYGCCSKDQRSLLLQAGLWGPVSWLQPPHPILLDAQMEQHQRSICPYPQSLHSVKNSWELISEEFMRINKLIQQHWCCMSISVYFMIILIGMCGVHVHTYRWLAWEYMHTTYVKSWIIML